MSKTLRPLAVLAMVALISLISAGCGANASSETGSASSSGTASSSDTARTTSRTGTTSSSAKKKLTASEKAVKFAECLRAHGVSDFPDPGAKNAKSYGVSVTPTVWIRANKACKDLAPPGAFSSKRTPKEQSAAIRFAQCVRAHGVKDFPDPVEGEPLIDTYKIPSSNKPGGMDILNAATDKCGHVLGDVVAGGGGGGSGG